MKLLNASINNTSTLISIMAWHKTGEKPSSELMVLCFIDICDLQRMVQLILGNHGSSIPDSIVYGAKMGPTWVLSAPGGPHVGPMNLAIRDIMSLCQCPYMKVLSHYLMQCLIFISEFQWQSCQGKIADILQPLIIKISLEILIQNLFKSLRGFWVQSAMHVTLYSNLWDFCALPIYE